MNVFEKHWPNLPACLRLLLCEEGGRSPEISQLWRDEWEILSRTVWAEGWNGKRGGGSGINVRDDERGGWDFGPRGF